MNGVYNVSSSLQSSYLKLKRTKIIVSAGASAFHEFFFFKIKSTQTENVDFKERRKWGVGRGFSTKEFGQIFLVVRQPARHTTFMV